MPTGKTFIRSRLGWLGTLTMLLGVADTVKTVVEGPTGQLIPQEYVGPGLAVLGAVTTLLRLATRQSITSVR